MEVILKGHTINAGEAEGEAIVYNGMFSFVGDLSLRTGKIPGKGHELEGKTLDGKVLVFTTGRGSTAGPYVAYGAKKLGYAPAAMICVEAEPVIAVGAITAEIPMMDRLDQNPLEAIRTGDYVKVNATKGTVTVVKRT